MGGACREFYRRGFPGPAIQAVLAVSERDRDTMPGGRGPVGSGRRSNLGLAAVGKKFGAVDEA